MKKMGKLMCLGAAVAVIALCFCVIQQNEARGGAAAAVSSRVAVCDLSKVFDDYKRAKHLNDQLNERRRKIKAEIEQRRETLEKTGQQLKGLNPGGEEYDKVLKKVQHLQVDMEVWRRIQEQTLLRDHLRLTRDMFDEISKAVGAIAAQKGIDLVVQLEPRDIQAKNSQELIAQLINRKVLYNKDTLDITGDVLRYVNEKYVTEK